MYNFIEKEEKILRFWQENKIFEKSIHQRKDAPNFVFFEGPPTANGKPGIHHVLSRAFKDVILRYKTMRGFFVERKAGWDTHGLPVELQIEKNLGLKNKKDIEKYGIAEFNKKCKESVWEYKKDWENLTERIGYWLDMKNPYITYDSEYIESVWWILKEIFKKSLLYQDYKVVPYCPRCGTSLSSHEVAQGYKTIKENSIYVKFPVKGQPNTYLLVWTTTPWTLPGNVAVAVGKAIDYVKVKTLNIKSTAEGKKEYQNLIIAKNVFDRIRNEDDKNILKLGFNLVYLHEEKLDINNTQIIEEYIGADLLGLEYEAVFDFIKPDKKAYFIISGDFVSTEEGTGLVHIAPAFGEDDMKVGKENNLPVLMTVDEEGKFKEEVKDWAGVFVKEADPLIINDLKNRKLLFGEEPYEHEYPFCWRCSSPLLYYAKTSWFIKMMKVKEELIRNNEKINWIPEHLKEGRFGEWLRDIKDWNLSRERYWGTPLPIWGCQKCKKQICIGSREELKNFQITKNEIEDLHRPYIDEIILKCECGGQMKRTPEVIDCWFDSGSMPYAQWHYPFENKEKIEKGISFPADYICEGIDQTRGWFYTLLAISTLLGFGPSYKNVISNGIVLDVKGQKMSKSKGNIITPSEVINRFGVDCIRLYFYTINSVAEPKRFNPKDLEDLSHKFFGTLWNSYIFLKTYTDEKIQPKKNFKFKTSLDKWIVSRLYSLEKKLTENLEKYYVIEAARLFEDFVDDLSNWYIRRSRKKFQMSENLEIKKEASYVLNYVLLELTKILAPFIPFIAEELYQNLKAEDIPESVHLTDWPEPDKKKIDKDQENSMDKLRNLVNLVLAERTILGIKVRQPLSQLKVKSNELAKEKELLEILKEEANVREIIFDDKLTKDIELNVELTDELKKEGERREFIRTIRSSRKELGVAPGFIVSGITSTASDVVFNEDELAKELGSKSFKHVASEAEIEGDVKKAYKFDGKDYYIGIKK